MSRTVPSRRLAGRGLLASALVAALSAALLAPAAAETQPTHAPTSTETVPFELVEASISDMHEAMEAGTVTSEQLTQMYLDRIEAYDQQGPALNTITNVNADALEVAVELDAERADGEARGPLHGVPVLLKDNYDTDWMPTTNSSLAMEESVPLQDSTQVAKLREAGAVILAKTNLHEYARGITTVSSLGGQTLNAYDPTRNPGGSSGGTGAAVAANLGAIGMGSDTCGSIRIPSAHNNLVGIRPTMGLSSRAGIIPLSSTTDTGGPMGRSVTDVAYVLDATVGPDERDPVTFESEGNIPDTYLSSLEAGSLEGARIGVFDDLFGDDPADQPVTDVVMRAIDEMEELGAEIVQLGERPPEIFEDLSSISTLDFKFDLEEYMDGLGPDRPFSTLQELYDQPELWHESLRNGFEGSLEVESRESEEYLAHLAQFEAAQEYTDELMAEENIDAFAYPSIQREAQPIGESQPGSTCIWSASTGLPAITVPAGFTDSGLPVGVELLGGAFEEPKLLGYAYDYEQATQYRVEAPTAPAIHDPVEPPTQVDSVCDAYTEDAGFSDVAGTGHDMFINCLAALGIVDGYTDGTFGPTNDVNRGQLASFVVRALEAAGHDLEPAAATFPDVNANSIHGDAIYKLVGDEVLEGYTDGTFGPWDSVSREQTATYVAGALELLLVDDLPTSGATFPDVSAGGTHAAAIDKLVTAGVVQGYTDGTFEPTEAITRAQMTRVIGNSLDVVADDGTSGGW